MGETSGSGPSPVPDRNGFVGGERPRSRWFPWIGDERGPPATDPREEPMPGHAATARGQRPQRCGTAVGEGNSSKGVNRCARNVRVSRTTSRWSRGLDAGNARNPRAGIGVQQTRDRRAEEAAEVVRNHEGGTRCRWMAPSARRRPRPPGVDARMVERQRGRKRASHERWRAGLCGGCEARQRLRERSEGEAKTTRVDPAGNEAQLTQLVPARGGGRFGNTPRARLVTAKAVGGAGKANDLLPRFPQR